MAGEIGNFDLNTCTFRLPNSKTCFAVRKAVQLKFSSFYAYKAFNLSILFSYSGVLL